MNGETEYIGGGIGHEKELAKAGIDLGANMIPDHWTKGLSADLVNSAKSKVGGVGAKESEQSIKNTVTTMFKANGEGLKIILDDRKEKRNNREIYKEQTDAIPSIREPILTIHPIEP